MKRFEYFSGKKQDFTFWSNNMISRNRIPQPKGLKKSGNTKSRIFGQGLVGECLEQKNPNKL